MTLGHRIRVLGGELLQWVRESNTLLVLWPGRRHTIEHPDYAQLRAACRSKHFIQQACEKSSTLLWAGGFTVTGEDPEAAAALNRFWGQRTRALWEAGFGAALFGVGNLVFEFDRDEKRILVRSEDASAVRRVPEKLRPWKTKAMVVKVEMDEGTYEQRVDREMAVTRLNGKQTDAQPNPYGCIPIVQVVERAAVAAGGVGVVNGPVFDVCDRYTEQMASSSDGEVMHSAPVPVLKGIKDSAGFRKAMEEGDWGPEQAIELTEKGEAGFLETKRGCEGGREQLKMLFYALVAESGIPEYLWGTHMKSAQASTKEQKKCAQDHAATRRLFWTDGLVEANRVVLAMLEVHLGKTFKTRETGIEWGPAVDADKKEDAETQTLKVNAVETARMGGLLSRESAMRALPDLVQDPEAELKAVKKEAAELADERGEPGEETTDEH